MDKVVESLETFELFALLFGDVCFGNARVVICEDKEVSFCYKSDGRD